MKFVLQPCKFRTDRFVNDREASPIEMDWGTLVRRLAPSKSPAALMNLKRLQVNSFVGLVRNSNTDEIGNFYFLNPDRSGTVEWLLEKDSSFKDRLVEVFRVVDVVWDSKIDEMNASP